MKNEKNKMSQLASKYWVLIMVMVFALGYIIGNSGKDSQNINEHNHEVSKVESKVWTCSMHPQIRQQEFGLCPICAMDLIALDNEGGDNEKYDPNSIIMSENAAALANIQTSVVKTQLAEKSLQLLGKVKPSEEMIYSQ